MNLRLLLKKTAVVFGFILIGIFFFWKFFLINYLTAYPDNFYFSADVLSIDNFFNEETNKFDVPQFSKTKFNFEVLEQKDNKLYIENSFNVKTFDGFEIIDLKRKYVVNKLDGSHFYGGDSYRNGYLFAPKNLTSKQEFYYWHINYDAPAKMQFVEKEIIEDLEVYKYRANFESRKIDQTDNLKHIENVGKTRGIFLEPTLEVWYEPVTGRLVKYKDDTTAYFYDLSNGQKQNVWNKFSNSLSKESISNNINEIKFLKTKHHVYQQIIPNSILVIGLVLLLFNLNLTVDLINNFEKQYFKSILYFVIFAYMLYQLVILYLVQFKILNIEINQNWFEIFYLFTTLAGLLILEFNKFSFAKIIAFLNTVFSISIITRIILLNFFSIRITQFENFNFIFDKFSLFFLFSLLVFNLIILFYKTSFLFKRSLISLTLLFIVGSYLILVFSYYFPTLGINNFLLYQNINFVTLNLILLICGGFYLNLKNKYFANLTLFDTFILITVYFSFTVLMFVFSFVINNNRKELLESNFRREISDIKNDISHRIDVYVNLLKSARGFINGSENVNRDEWMTFVNDLELQKNFPGIQGLGYSTFIPKDKLAEHEKIVQEEGFPEYKIKPAGDREIYSSVIFIEPFDERNKQAFGFDMFQEPNRRFAMEQARDIGQPKVSSKVILVQEIENDVQPGFLIYVPVYNQNADLSTTENRREQIIGYTYSAFRAKNFFESIFGINGYRDYGIKIYDGVYETEENSIYNDIQNRHNEFANTEFFDSENLYVLGRPWTISFYSDNEYGVSKYYDFVNYLLIIFGYFFSFVITAYIYKLLVTKQNTENILNDLSNNLSDIKADSEAILLSITDGLVAVDRFGKVKFVNSYFEKILGLSSAEIIGKNFVQFVKAYDQNQVEISPEFRMITKVLENKQFKNTEKNIYFYKNSSGKMIPVELTVSPIIVRDELIGAIEVFRDYTKTNELNKAKTDFVSTVSHQLRTPITAINWMAELFINNEKNVSKESKDYVIEIQKAGKKMSEMIEQLLMLSGIELDTYEYEFELLDLYSIFENVIVANRDLIAQKNIKINKNTISLPVISLDRKIIERVISILIENAVLYSNDNSKIEIEFTNEQDFIEVKIKDYGIGIPKDQIENIFQKMFRTDISKKVNTEGKGLGLYFCKLALQKMNSDIVINSEEGNGTTVTIILKK